MPPIILGHDMADEIGATVGSVVLVTSPQGELTPFGMVPKYIRFHVAGIFNSGFFDYDSSWAFIRLSDAQQLFGLGDVISVIQFKIDDIYLAGDVARSLEQGAGHGFMTTTWMEQNKPLFRALRLERVVTFITIGLIVFVAALNILISLIMMVMEKTKDIAVLMSLGTKKAQIRRVFIAQGVLIGVIGTAIGLALGYAISWAGGHYHFISLSPEVYSIDYVPFAPRLIDGVIVALGFDWHFVRGHDLSIVVGGADSAGGGATVRVGRWCGDGAEPALSKAERPRQGGAEPRYHTISQSVTTVTLHLFSRGIQSFA